MFLPNRFEESSSEQSSSREEIKEVPVQEQANFKGNYSELLFSRMQNPVVRNQLLDMLEENEKWIAEHPESESVMKVDPGTGEAVLDDLGMNIFETVTGAYVPKSREELSRELDEAMTQEMSVTKIDFEKTFDKSAAQIIDPEKDRDKLEAVIGVKKEPHRLNEEEIRDHSLVEAHEKGHVLRNLKHSGYFEKRFSAGFDTSKVTPEAYLGKDIAEKSTELTDQDIKGMIDEYLFDFKKPVEILERMSQLKNYFGMKGDEKFTPQHLEYARTHYTQDVGLENHMQAFFQAITPETEFTFLNLMNSSGV